MNEALEEPIPDCGGDRFWDHDLFEDCLHRAGKVREGYWSPFVTLAWVATGDEKFLAAVQIFEAETHANRGSLHAAAAWWTIGNEAGERFGATLTMASEALREALETGRCRGGIARDIRSGEVSPIDAHMWPSWSQAYIHEGLSLLPGRVDFKWPSAEVRKVAPIAHHLVGAPSIVARPAKKYNNRRPTPGQQEAFRFFSLAKAYMRDGSHETDVTGLHRIYLARFKDGAKQPLRGKPLALTQFKECVRRFYVGDRIDPRRARWAEEAELAAE